jgi:hypothetical protein
MATTDFLLKQSTTNNRHVHTPVLEKREKIWHWDKAGFRFVNCEITI